MVRYSKGPWRVKRGPADTPDQCHIHICGDGFILAVISGPKYAHCLPNASLIAAAPDLLEACRYIVEAGDTGDEVKAIEMARAAIEKAEANA